MPEAVNGQVWTSRRPGRPVISITPNDGDAVLIVDETADEKSSAGAARAARQYSGTVGGIALCQVAVTLTYATGRGHALIGRALQPARRGRR